MAAAVDPIPDLTGLDKTVQLDVLSDPLDAASICLDGVDLVVTTLCGRDIPPTRARALLARIRSHASVLISTNGRIPGLDLAIESRPVTIAGIEQGRAVLEMQCCTVMLNH